jgi:exosortase K
VDSRAETTVAREINRIAGGVLAVGLMLALKWHYSSATAGQLIWMLAPTARMTAWFTAVHPVWEQGTGYVDFGRGIIIAPACAGINFMIMAFGLAAFCGLLRIRRLTPLLAWLVASLAGAYSLALTVNVVRIVISMGLYQAEINTAWLTVARVHRLAGIGIYLSALGLFFKTLAPIIDVFCLWFDSQDRLESPPRIPAWLPLGWYLVGAVGVPTANLLFRNPTAGYREHCITVILAGLVLYIGGLQIRRISSRCANPARCAHDSERTEKHDVQGADCRG